MWFGHEFFSKPATLIEQKFIMMSCSKNFSSRGDLFFLFFFAGLFFVRWLDWIFNGAQPQSVSIKSTSPLTNI